MKPFGAGSVERSTSVPTVLFVDHAEGMGGAEHSLLALLAALDRARYRPVLAAVPGPPADRARALGIAVHTLPLAQLKGHPTALIAWLRGARALAAVARHEQAAILHANVLRAAVYTAPAAGMLRLPWVWHVRDILARGPTTRLLCRSAAEFVAISHAAAAALPCAGRARVIYNPVSVPAADRRTRAELGLPAHGLLVASVGRLRGWKGHHAFLDAAARVEYPHARFVVIGGQVFTGDREEADEAGRLAAHAAALGIADRVTFTGHRDDLADIWPHLALVAHAAAAEPFGRVVAEAQCAGRPVVAFRDGGVPEIVENGATGFLVPPGNVEALAAAVDHLLEDGPLRAQFGEAGRARAVAAFDPAAHARAVEAVYDAVLRYRARPS